MIDQEHDLVVVSRWMDDSKMGEFMHVVDQAVTVGENYMLDAICGRDCFWRRAILKYKRDMNWVRLMFLGEGRGGNRIEKKTENT